MTGQKLGPNQKKWVKALRSGDYKQGAEYLLCANEYCCLGVAAAELGVDESEIDGVGDLETHTDVIEAYALHDEEGKLFSARLNGWENLAKANDEGATFSEIADFIEANPGAVFSKPS